MDILSEEFFIIYICRKKKKNCHFFFVRERFV